MAGDEVVESLNDWFTHFLETRDRLFLSWGLFVVLYLKLKLKAVVPK